MALLPAVARTPAQLVAANVTSSAAEGLGTFVGPARRRAPARRDRAARRDPRGPRDLRRSGVAGHRHASHVPAVGRSDTSAAAVLGPALGRGRGGRDAARAAARSSSGSALQTFVRGLLTVLVVVAAIELLGHGRPRRRDAQRGAGPGRARSAPCVAITLAGRDRLSPGLPPRARRLGRADRGHRARRRSRRWRSLAMIVVGVSNAFIDVAGFTLIQRMTPNASRIAVLGLSTAWPTAASRSAASSRRSSSMAFGIRGGARSSTGADPADRRAPVAAGPAPDRRGRRRRSHGGSSCSAATRCSRRCRWPPSSTSPRASQPVAFDDGDVAHARGRARRATTSSSRPAAATIVQGGQPSGTLGPGSGVGEIALLRDVPRTASVRRVGPVTAFSLDAGRLPRGGHRPRRRAAPRPRRVVEEHLAADTRAPGLH